MKDTIILIEDEILTGQLIRLPLREHGYEVIWYRTLEKAFDRLTERSKDKEDFFKIKAIIFDYSLDYEQSSIPLVQMVVNLGFPNPIIANSLDQDHNKRLKNAGCTHVRPGTGKAGVVKFLLEEVFGAK